MSFEVQQQISTVYGLLKGKKMLIAAIADNMEKSTYTVRNWFRDGIVPEDKIPSVIESLIIQYKSEQKENNEIIKNLQQWITQEELQ